jgi:hypothetical protein
MVLYASLAVLVVSYFLAYKVFRTEPAFDKSTCVILALVVAQGVATAVYDITNTVLGIR